MSGSEVRQGCQSWRLVLGGRRVTKSSSGALHPLPYLELRGNHKFRTCFYQVVSLPWAGIFPNHCLSLETMPAVYLEGDPGNKKGGSREHS